MFCCVLLLSAAFCCSLLPSAALCRFLLLSAALGCFLLPSGPLCCVLLRSLVFIWFRVGFGTILGQFWDHFGTIFGPFWCLHKHVGNRVGIGSGNGPHFGVHFGCIFGSLLMLCVGSRFSCRKGAENDPKTALKWHQKPLFFWIEFPILFFVIFEWLEILKNWISYERGRKNHRLELRATPFDFR